MSNNVYRRHAGEFHWQDVEVLAYKQTGEAPFKDVTRQVLFEDPQLACQWRYFEVAPGDMKKSRNAFGRHDPLAIS